MNGTAEQMFRSLVERIETLSEEKDTIARDIRDVYLEARGQGFDVKVLRRIIKDRKKDRAERQEEETLYKMYASAIGLLPLFDTAETEQ